MAVRALKCPSCGADITLDDSREFGFCAYCGSRIQIGERVNVHVTHEFKGDTPDINVTNNYYGEGSKNNEPGVTVEKPGNKRLGWGIALAIIGIIGLCSSEGKQFSYIVVCLIFMVVAAVLLVSYSRDIKLYRDAARSRMQYRKHNK